MDKASLICLECQKKFPIECTLARCTSCGEPLEVVYGNLEAGSIHSHRDILQRYHDFLPFDNLPEQIGLGEGNTPLIKSLAAANILGLKNLFFKVEYFNPTWSFKDRGTAAGIAHARSMGIQRIGTVSTGNMAASIAAYGARSEFDTFVLVSRDMPVEKIAPIAVYGPRLIRVDGDYGDLYYRSLEIGEAFGVYFINSDVPLRVEGSKTIAFEICEQFDFKVPDVVVVPVSAGGNLRGIIKGFEEFLRAGLIAGTPLVVAAQATGCSPIADAFGKESSSIERIAAPHTIAHAIENPYPPSGNRLLRKLREIGGMAVSVTDQEILAAQALMARDGIFGQPAAAVPLAATRKLLTAEQIRPSDSVACVVTGGGLKYTAALEHFTFDVLEARLENLENFF